MMWPRKARAGVVQEARVLHRGGADDDVADAVVEVALDRVEVADAAAQLHRDLVADRADDRRGSRARSSACRRTRRSGRPGAGAARPARASAAPSRPGPRRRRWPVHVALLQAHAVAVLEVDRGNDQHGSGDGWMEAWRRDARAMAQGCPVRRSWRSSCRPARCALFGVELGGENIIPRHRAGKARAVVGRRRRVSAGVVGHGVVAVHEIEAAAVGDARPTADAAAPGAPRSSPCAAP